MEKNAGIVASGILIKGGTIVNSDSRKKADVAITDGKIKAVGRLDTAKYEGYRVVDAKGKYILPGAIDPHVHLSLPTPAGNSSDDFVSGSLAALSGGTTAFIDFVTPRRGQSLIEALQLRRKEAASSKCSWKLHLGISEWNSKVREELLHCIKYEGITSVKVYLAYRNSIGISFDDLEQLMECLAPENTVLLIHCEDGEAIDEKIRLLIRQKKTSPHYHALSRPPETEYEAIRKVIELSEQTGCRVYVVHTSTSQGAQLIREAKDKGLKAHGETCIQYLILDDEVYDPSETPEMVLPFVISPPIRSMAHQQLLWKGLSQGTFDTVATDHCPFNLFGQKDRGIDDFTLIPNGAGGIEYRLSLLYTYGVLSNFISMEQLVGLTSREAALLFGWGSNKGRIAAGFDADLVVWNPDFSTVITRKEQKQRCDSNIYEGIPINGKAEIVISAGRVI